MTDKKKPPQPYYPRGITPEELVVEIQRYRSEHGYSPSRREMAEQLDIGLESVQRALAKLIEDGLIETTPGVARSINITGTGMKIVTESM